MADPNWSLGAFGLAAAARNGLVALPPAVDTTQYTVISTNYAQMPKSGIISYLMPMTAAVATAVRAVFRRRGEANFNDMRFLLDQTKSPPPGWPIPVNIPYAPQDQFEAQVDNSNNSQIDKILFIHGNKLVRFQDKPPNIKGYISGTATTALTADVWSSPGAITWSETFDPQRTYKIVGLGGLAYTTSVLGYGLRLVYPNGNHRPGVPIATLRDRHGMYFGDFGSFIGNTPPTVECLSGGASDDVDITIAVV